MFSLGREQHIPFTPDVQRIRGFVLEDFPQSPMEAGQSFANLHMGDGAGFENTDSHWLRSPCPCILPAALSAAVVEPQKVLVVHFADRPHAVCV